MFFSLKSVISRRRSVIKALVIVSAFVFSFAPALAKAKDQHDVEATLMPRPNL